MPPFVDVHSHVVPSGDDGVTSVAEGLELAREAARRGTAVLYATPHVWPAKGLSAAREAAVRATHAEMAAEAADFGLELRLGFELTPAAELLTEDLTRYELAGAPVPSVLVEFPFRGSLDLVVAVAEAAEVQGLLPVLAHPERADAIFLKPGRAAAFAARGWPLQVNASSLLGRHGRDAERLGWELVERGLAGLIASDGHRRERPPFLDDAYRAVRARVGESATMALFDGSCLEAAQPARTGTRG